MFILQISNNFIYLIILKDSLGEIFFSLGELIFIQGEMVFSFGNRLLGEMIVI